MMRRVCYTVQLCHRDVVILLEVPELQQVEFLEDLGSCECDDLTRLTHALLVRDLDCLGSNVMC